MREIKFRAWIPEAEILYENPMYYQNNQYLSSFLRRIYDQFVTGHPSNLPFKVEDRLMQFTGLKDKNGKEIYEGDVLESNVLLGDGNTRSVVRWLDTEACFVGNGLLSNEPVYMANHQPEVIGNIYENPELLK